MNSELLNLHLTLSEFLRLMALKYGDKWIYDRPPPHRWFGIVDYIEKEIKEFNDGNNSNS